jgi:hypothetical protein
MSLDETQRKRVAEWIEQGLKLSEIQNRLGSELGVQMTYMEVRFLVDDLKLTPRDVEPLKPVQSPLVNAGPAPAASAKAAGGKPGFAGPGASSPPAGGAVSVSVDQLTRPGALVSGKVTFSDGNRADWYLDQTGRLGLMPQQAGYRPPAADVQQFQAALDSELAKLGF